MIGLQSTHRFTPPGFVPSCGIRTMNTASGQRFMLWIDAVGGFLVSAKPRTTIGQAVSGHAVDIPVWGDLSRRHASFCRAGEGYVLEAHEPVTIGGRAVDGQHALRDGDEIRLGKCVSVRFRQPHALSPTARLEWISGHRTDPVSDGVVLMADTLVMGPSLQNHVVCRSWSQDVVLARQSERLRCRSTGPFRVDGRDVEGLVSVSMSSLIQGEEFSLRLEALDDCPRSAG